MAASCSAYFACWRRLTRPLTAVAVPAITAVRMMGLRRIIILVVLFSGQVDSAGFGQFGERGFDQVVGDPPAFEHDAVGATNGVGEVSGPQILPDQEGSRAI